MSAVLSSLKLVNVKRPTEMPPVQIRRNKLSNKLYQQIQLATAMLDGSTYAPKRMRSVRDRHTGEIKTMEMPVRVRQWWFTSDNGKICIQLKYGSKTLDITKGKNSVEVSSNEELIKVLDVLKSAVDAGELDAQIETAGAKLREGFRT